MSLSARSIFPPPVTLTEPVRATLFPPVERMTCPACTSIAPAASEPLLNSTRLLAFQTFRVPPTLSVLLLMETVPAPPDADELPPTYMLPLLLYVALLRLMV